MDGGQDRSRAQQRSRSPGLSTQRWIPTSKMTATAIYQRRVWTQTFRDQSEATIGNLKRRRSNMLLSGPKATASQDVGPR